MSVENYTNNASTSLTAGYTSGSGSITVTTTAGNFPTAAPFRVGIFDTAGALVVLLKVTAITDGTHFAVTAEGTDASASSGATVRHLLTAGGMDGIRIDQHQYGTLANLPSTTGQKQGNTYKCTDGPIDFIFDGSNWQAYVDGINIGTSSAVPTTATFGTTVSSSSDSFTDAGGILWLSGQNTTQQVRVTSTPSAPYSRTLCLSAGLLAGGACGFCLRNSSSGKLRYFFANAKASATSLELYSQTYSAIGSFNGTDFGGIAYQNSRYLWLRLTDDNTNIAYEWSPNGKLWFTLLSLGRTSYFTPDQIGVFIVGSATYKAGMHIVGYF